MTSGEVKENMVVPIPQVSIPNHPKEVENDKANDIIMNLEAMAEGGTDASNEKTIEKTTAGKIMEGIKWVDAVIASVYVLSVLSPSSIDNSTIIYIWLQKRLELLRFHACPQHYSVHCVHTTTDPVRVPTYYAPSLGLL